MDRKQYATLAAMMVAASFVGGALAVYFMQETGIAGGRVTVRELQVMERPGGPRILLGVTQSGAAVNLYGAGGRLGSTFQTTGGEANISFFEGADPRVGMGVYSNGSGVQRLDVQRQSVWRD